MVPDSGPESGHHAHRHTGHRWLDMVLAVSAVVISLVSLFLAIQHGRVMEKMVEGSTWPYVLVGMSTANLDGSPHVSLWIANKGVGPARIDSLEVFHRDVAQSDPQGLLRSILGSAESRRHFDVVQSDVIDTVLSAKDMVNFVDLEPAKYDPAEYSRIQDGMDTLQFRVCYCSVFEECSLLDTRRSPPRPVPVKACPTGQKLFQH